MRSIRKQVGTNMTAKQSTKKSHHYSAARAARMPVKINPMLATLVDEPFSDTDWIFETK